MPECRATDVALDPVLPILYVHHTPGDGPHLLDWSGIRYWTPTIGPTATVILLELNYIYDPWTRTRQSVWHTEELASRCGLTFAQLQRVLHRLAHFGLIEIINGDAISLPDRLPVLPYRAQLRLPTALGCYYDENFKQWL